MISIFSLIINNIKLILSKKSFIIMGIICPALIIVFFTFMFGKEYTYKVGILDNDKNYISNEIIKIIDNIGNIEIINLENENYEMLLSSHEIEIALIINKNFTENILNLKEDEIIIKSIHNNDIKQSLVSIINSKIEDLSLIAKLSNKDLTTYKKLYKNYLNEKLSFTVNKVKKEKFSIENSIGIIIMMIFITGGTIANFLIEEEENNTKYRILSSNINKVTYYISLIIVFYLISCISTLLYYYLCKALSIDFGVDNPKNILIILLTFNAVSIASNLCIVSFSKSRYLVNTINIMVIIPSCMLSGSFWDFNIMPKYLQNIGQYMPPRWVYECLDILKVNNDIVYINKYLIYMVMLTLILFSISLIKLNKDSSF